MKKMCVLLLAFTLLAFQTGGAQEILPLIHANNELVNIRDGSTFSEGQWTIVPEAKPDIYTSGNIGQRVTFYTDADSISFTIHPDSIYNFIILLHGKDSAFTQIKYEPTYLDILKKAAAFNEADKTVIPEFTYQDSSDLVLKSLRKALNLDSIAGSGNEISKILNLMHWIHNLIPHDGNHDNPAVKNAMSMIAQCKKEGRGLNCRGLAIVLNECYLSLGIKSRFITCMPKDSVFNDCHVINMVFSSELQKWIWIDPTNDAYIMDENGLLLGLEEVRERLINGKTLILNPDANWNKKVSTLKENYLYEYMAKNLYRFDCPLRSEYNYETWEKGRTVNYVELIPLDGLNQEPKFSEHTNTKTGVTFKTCKTNNPAVFWAVPR